MPRPVNIQPYGNSPRHLRPTPRRSANDPGIRMILDMTYTQRHEAFRDYFSHQAVTTELFFYDRKAEKPAEFPL